MTPEGRKAVDTVKRLFPMPYGIVPDAIAALEAEVADVTGREWGYMDRITNLEMKLALYEEIHGGAREAERQTESPLTGDL